MSGREFRARLATEHGLKREQVLKRSKHFTRGVIIGSRLFIEEWFQRNRAWFGGSSAAKRTTGAPQISKDWPRLLNLRPLRGRE